MLDLPVNACRLLAVVLKLYNDEARHKAKTVLQGLAPQVRRRCAYGQFATQLVLLSPCVDEICGQPTSSQGKNCTAGPGSAGKEEMCHLWAVCDAARALVTMC
jgi:hypothetical protein